MCRGGVVIRYSRTSIKVSNRHVALSIQQQQYYHDCSMGIRERGRSGIIVTGLPICVNRANKTFFFFACHEHSAYCTVHLLLGLSSLKTPHIAQYSSHYVATGIIATVAFSGTHRLVRGHTRMVSVSRESYSSSLSAGLSQATHT